MKPLLKKSRHFYVTLILLFILSSSQAQFRLGLSTGNYAGVNGVFLNPSSISNSKVYLDMLVVGGNFNVHNNYVYIPKEQNSLNKKINLFSHLSKFEFPDYYGDEFPFSDKFTKDPKNGFTDFVIAGPALMFSRNGDAFAMHFSSRVVSSGSNIPYDLAKFGYERRQFPELYGVEFSHNQDFGGASVSWSEVGFTYSKSFNYHDLTKIAAGISLRSLWSYHGVVLHSSQMDYVIENKDSMDIRKFKGKLGIALPVCFESNQFLGFNDAVQGKGFAMDVGITIIQKDNYEFGYQGHPLSIYTPYKYRLGLSLIDIGAIRYNNNLRMLHFDNITAHWGGMDQMDFVNINCLIDDFKAVVDDKSKITETESFNIWLPAAISLQFDYNLGNSLFLNTLWVQGIRFSDQQVMRPAQFSISPRYETRMFEVAFPVSLLQYQKVQAGLALRYGFFSLGTDRLGTFLGVSDLQGMDVYFAFKIGLCRQHHQKVYDRYERFRSFF